MRALGLVCLMAGVLAGCAPQGGRGRAPGTTPGDGGNTPVDVCSNGTRDMGESDVDCGGSCAPCGDGLACAVATDCSSEFCGPGYLCSASVCNNGVQDAGETGTDCGGDCAACLGDACGANPDCQSGFCNGGTCDTPSCTDGVQNGLETAADCGASCPHCEVGQACVSHTDCATAFCNLDRLCAEVSCDDGVLNGPETAVDCGGQCGACAEGLACLTATDCLSNKCTDGLCQLVQNTCEDKALSSNETDVDCGGECLPCGFGLQCAGEADCKSGICEAGVCGAPATCSDVTLTPGETDVDCGGACPASANGKGCKAHGDCLSATCVFGQCATPACDDLVHSGTETDVDCGGACGACADGRMCSENTDCQGGNCEGGKCGSCVDGLLNGAETDVDCGGVCGACGDGLACGSADDCSGGGCDDGACCTVNACGFCGALGVETCNGKDDDCNGYTDDGLEDSPQACALNKGVCASLEGWCGGSDGWVCESPEELGDYEATEVSCDGLDNDCDGQTDEAASCKLCAAAPVAVMYPGVVGGVSSDFLEIIGGVPTVVALTADGGVRLTRQSMQHFGAGMDGAPAIAVKGGKPMVVGRHGTTEKVYDDNKVIYSRTNTHSDSAVAIDARGGTVAYASAGSTKLELHVSNNNGVSFSSKQLGSSALEWQVEILDDGTIEVPHRSLNGFFYNKGTISSSKVVGLDFAYADGLDLGVFAYKGAFSDSISWNKYEGGEAAFTEGGPVSAERVAVTVDSDGGIYMATLMEDSLRVHKRSSFGWTLLGEQSIGAAPEGLHPIRVRAIAPGVVTAAINVKAEGTAMVFTTLCQSTEPQVPEWIEVGETGGECVPACGGKVCGTDGCGGSCGACDGTCSASGQCTPTGNGGMCGADAANTCDGRCGDYTEGAACQCDSGCADFSDCCSDKAPCCE